MSDADLRAALSWALTGRLSGDGDGDALVALAEEGWDAQAIATHSRAVISSGGVWPHPVPDDLRRRVGSARLLAAVHRAQRSLGLFGQPAAPVAPRALNADERRLQHDVPPHHGS